MEKKNIILSKSFDFSLKVMQFAEVLLDGKRYSISNQLLKSGTSIGANIWEAQNAESKMDFIHKLKMLPRRLMKQNTGYFCVSTPKTILIQMK